MVSRRIHPEIQPGQRFGRLIALRYAEGSTPRRERWQVVCDCGTEKSVATESLRRGRSQSCGCLHREIAQTHGHHGTPEWDCWNNILNRCLNQDSPGFRNYGGRGITVCRRWAGSFAAFLEDVGLRPSSTHSLDRIRNDRGYEPGNVRWATPTEQARNTRRNRIVLFQGREMPLVEACEISGIPYDIARGRLRTGWEAERALTTPARAPTAGVAG